MHSEYCRRVCGRVLTEWEVNGICETCGLPRGPDDDGQTNKENDMTLSASIAACTRQWNPIVSSDSENEVTVIKWPIRDCVDRQRKSIADAADIDADMLIEHGRNLVLEIPHGL